MATEALPGYAASCPRWAPRRGAPGHLAG